MAGTLALSNVTKRFGELKAADAVTLDIPAGSFFGLLGPSGCGKTTTLRLIAGFEFPDHGEILLDGADLSRRKPFERPVSTVFQNYALFPHLSVRGNIEFGLRRQKRSSAEIERRVADMIDLVRLNGKEHQHPDKLSGGERQRVALARSLAVAPSVLLLDEPLSALDPGLRADVRTELKALQRRVGTTFVFVTHDREEALSLSDRMALMNKGTVEQTGTPEDIYLRPRTRFVAAFLGPLNWIDGIGVRPEATHISRLQPVNGTRSVLCTVHASTFLGSCVQVKTKTCEGETLMAQVPLHEASYAEGEKVHMWWHPRDEIGSLKA